MSKTPMSKTPTSKATVVVIENRGNYPVTFELEKSVKLAKNCEQFRVIDLADPKASFEDENGESFSDLSDRVMMPPEIWALHAQNGFVKALLKKGDLTAYERLA